MGDLRRRPGQTRWRRCARKGISKKARRRQAKKAEQRRLQELRQQRLKQKEDEEFVKVAKSVEHLKQEEETTVKTDLECLTEELDAKLGGPEWEKRRRERGMEELRDDVSDSSPKHRKLQPSPSALRIPAQSK